MLPRAVEHLASDDADVAGALLEAELPTICLRSSPDTVTADGHRTACHLIDEYDLAANHPDRVTEPPRSSEPDD